MIVLDRVDPAACGVAWTSAHVMLPGASEIRTVEERLRSLGIVHFKPLTEASKASISHRWSATLHTVEYRSEVALDELVPIDHAFYVAAMLATMSWGQLEELLSVQLALYELIVNVHEHGRPLPDSDGVLALRLALSPTGIEGELFDACERFDPADRPPIDVASRLTRRESRGYGVAMIERSLDRITYDAGSQGNAVRFSKRIQS